MKDREKDIQDNTKQKEKRPYKRPEIMFEETFEPEVDAQRRRRSPVRCLRRPAQGGPCRFIPRLS